MKEAIKEENKIIKKQKSDQDMLNELTLSRKRSSKPFDILKGNSAIIPEGLKPVRRGWTVEQGSPPNLSSQLTGLKNHPGHLLTSSIPDSYDDLDTFSEDDDLDEFSGDSALSLCNSVSLTVGLPTSLESDVIGSSSLTSQQGVLVPPVLPIQEFLKDLSDKEKKVLNEKRI